ncbi:MAG TPA: transcription antitermination factor NusB, partial [Pyrinomonadaceae bacterium]|nr:transcription antitermination factor NusB [Pyrinomonadaceae bacterium]
PSAVVNEAVNLAYRSRVSSAAGFINAVLRRALKEPEYDPAQSLTDPTERLSVETSHPRWLIERWTNAFGRDATAEFAHANNETPPTAFRVVVARSKGRDVLEELRAAAEELSPSEIAHGAWRIRGAGALVRKLAQDGLIYVQDEASQLVAQVLDAKAHDRVLDVCAAPGSKTTHIADGAESLKVIVAGDLYEHRLRAVLESAGRQKALAVRCVAYDATRALPFAEGSFDRVLVDAPCTGTGTLRRNPEIRWRISERDIRDLSLRQRAILQSASRMLRPDGGRLVYSTCSVELEENESVVASFLEEGGAAFRQVSVAAPERLLTAAGAARTWPQRDQSDGFFIAAFERRS